MSPTTISVNKSNQILFNQLHEALTKYLSLEPSRQQLLTFALESALKNLGERHD